jgi:hypothetical protein
MRARNQDLSPAECGILSDIDDYGVHIEHVSALEAPGWSFTVGLWHRLCQPEIVVFGLPDDVAHELLDLVADLAADGRRFLAGSVHDDLLEGYPVRFRAVPKAHFGAYLGAAVWAHEGDGFDAVQLIWPDKQGRWPWEDVREGFRALQPVLDQLPLPPHRAPG